MKFQAHGLGFNGLPCSGRRAIAFSTLTVSAMWVGCDPFSVTPMSLQVGCQYVNGAHGSNNFDLENAAHEEH